MTAFCFAAFIIYIASTCNLKPGVLVFEAQSLPVPPTQAHTQTRTMNSVMM